MDCILLETVWVSWGRIAGETGPDWMFLWRMSDNQLVCMELVTWVSWVTVSGKVAQNMSIAVSLAVLNIYSFAALRCVTFQRPVVNICTASLTFNNSTFCPHGVFMCSLWIWEQTAIIFLYNINWLVFITESYLKPGGHYMYYQFNIQQFYVLPTQCIYVFCVDLRTNGDYFPIQH